MDTLNRAIGSSVILISLSTPVMAGGISQHIADSLDHSAQAVVHTTAAGIKIVSGVVALPLMLGGEIGKVSGEIGEGLWEEANSPLPVTEEVITAGPRPSEAMTKSETE